MSVPRRVLIALTLLLSGRAMTLAFLSRAGGGGPGDPPAVWLMPLAGDAVIGVAALGIAFLLWSRPGFWTWTLAVVWNALGIWDALSAYLIHVTAPWPSFFMIEAFGSPMFFVASAMHGVCLWLLCRREGRRAFSVAG